MVQLAWKGDLAFEAKTRTGERFVLNGDTAIGSDLEGPSPMQALLGAIGACAAMDVIAILEKKRQKVTGYRVVVEGDRPPEGSYPRPFLAVRIKHFLTGENLDPEAIKRAVQLSEEKYCSVSATLRGHPSLSSEWTIEN